jgi:hypothetical protein
MLTRAEARSAVEASLRARGAAKRLTPVEMLQFCRRMHARLQFRSKGDRMSDIRQWAEPWGSTQAGNAARPMSCFAGAR